MILSKRPDVERLLKGPGPEFAAALFYGRDRGVAAERAATLAKRIAPDLDDPFRVAVLTDTDVEADPARLEEELTALSMIGGRRLVRLKLSTEKAGPDKAAAAALQAHADQAGGAEGAFFLIEAGALGRESALRKAAEKLSACACVPCYEDEAGDLARLVREGLAADRISITAEALDAFVARLPKERGVARSEIERLALYAGPGSGVTLDLDAVKEVLGVEPEASLFEAANDAFGGRPGPAQSGLRRAFDEGESGPAAVRAAGQHLARLHRVMVLAKSGAGLKEAAKAAGVFWKQEREFLRQVNGWTPSEIEAVRLEITEADRACKRAGSPDALLAERLFLMIALKARRQGL
ncbi:DNA polymerase III subunit delta [Brevundimonas sp. 2R-24]|uniref:DNA-directed DNA polymerase n=1 Tax=Peiella sedimenti TaxID=3061083 RepID=A0ABT8SKP8_9CAUL|nr:DNA polymerase III subunit delta [Caulobacteraceae bacterium XZ-24]